MQDFDEVIERRGTESYKWDNGDPVDCIPMPVADMDFRCPQPILAALDKVTAHGIMGYSIISERLIAVFRQRLLERYGWLTHDDWQVWAPGLIPSLTAVCQLAGQPGDAVMTSIPAYYPIHLAPGRTGKQLQVAPMVLEGNRWTLDFQAIEKSITSKTALFILCNPQNPGGTVFTKSELQRLVDICSERQILLCSDEIHCDLILEQGKQHVPLGSLGSKAEQITITLMAPSKTFNIAGLGCSVAVIPNPELRARFESIKMAFFPFLSRYAIKAAESAYTECEAWRKDLVGYLKENHDFLLREINQIDGLTMYPLEATYLAWIKADYSDFSKKLLDNGLRVLDGAIYLKEGFFRLNFACPRSVLEEAIKRIKKTVYS